MGIPVGSEVAIAFAGAVPASGQVVATDGHHDHFSLAVVIIVAIVAKIVGSIAGYAIGLDKGAAHWWTERASTYC